MIIHDVAQNEPEWLQLRAGMPTASNFAKLITSKGEPSKSLPTYANLLAAELFAQKPLNDFEGNQWTERGHELEEDARSQYEFLNDCDVQQVGFVTDDEKSFGCSPDGLVNDDGMTEIKCLKTENHVEAILYFEKHKKCPPKYVPQTQGQIHVCQRKWCDLIFFHPDLPTLTIRQEPDEEVIGGLISQLHRVREVRDLVLETLRAA